MKIFVYSYREFDEAEFFRNFQKNMEWSLESVRMHRRWKMHIWQKVMNI